MTINRNLSLLTPNVSATGTVNNAGLTSSTITIGSTAITLGSSATTVAGLTSVTSTGFTGALTGNASTATTLQTSRTIGGVSFNGSANIDLPGVNTAGNQNTTGTASNVSGTVAIINGGTGQTTRQAALDALAGSVTAGQYLRGDGTDVVMSAIQAGDVPTLNQNTTGSAATLTTARTIALTGDVTYTSGSFNGSANVTGTATLANSGATAGTYGSATNIPQIAVDAKGRITSVSNVAVSIPSGSLTFTGDVTGTGSTGSSTALTLAAVGTSGTYTKVTTDSKGRVTSGTTLAASDIPNLDAAKITSGVIDAARLPSYVDDVVEAANLASFPATGETGKIYVALDTNKVYRWSGTVYVYITSGAVDSVAGKTGVVTLVAGDVGLGNVENKSSATIRSEITSGNVTAALGFTPYNATNPSGYITSAGTAANVSGTVAIANGGTGATTAAAALTSLGAYPASNPNGYTTNTGTVTSVAGTGTVSGLTLTGTVTGSGNLTLGGTLSLTSGDVTSALGFTPYNATNPSNYITSSGTATNVSGTVAIANGGTGQTTRQAAMDALAGSVTSGQYLRGDGTDVVMSAIQAADVPTLNQNTTGTAANVTGIVAVANGGTGTATPGLVAGTNITVSGSFPNQTINAAGGLTGFTAAESTAAPNATVFVDALTAAAASTNADIALVAKGTGATLAQVPDSATSGGDKRGAYATDFQKIRTASNQVASGSYAVISGGYGNRVFGAAGAVVGGFGNTATGSSSFIGGGEVNTTSSAYSFVGGGFTNTAQTGTYSTVVGGANNIASGKLSFVGGGGDEATATNRNTASGANSVVVGGSKNRVTGINSFIGGGNSNDTIGNYATFTGGLNNSDPAGYSYVTCSGGATNVASAYGAVIGGGVNNVATGSAAAVLGGQYGTTRAIAGMQAHSACYGAIAGTLGISQGGYLIIGTQTTNATATRLTSNSSAAATTNQVILPNNSAYYVKGSIIATVTGGGNTKSWDFVATIKRGANAASTAIVGTVALNVQAADAGAATWLVAITADTTNGGLAVTCTGQAATTIRWVAKLETTEVTY